MDVFNLCRSCMKEVTIWEHSFDQKTMDMFCYCTNTQIVQDDPLPKHFCTQCTLAIQSCWAFITTARDVEIKLRNVINTVTVKTETEFNELEHLELKSNDNSNSFDTDDMKLEKTTNSFDASQSNNLKMEPVKREGEVDIEDPIKAMVVEIEYVSRPRRKKENKKDLFPCMVCNKIFTRKGNLDNHMFNSHDAVVKGSDSNPASVKHKHKRRKPHGRRHKCQHCSERFSNYKALTEHERTHGKKVRKNCAGMRKYTCNFCNKVFSQKSRLLTHLYVHDNTLKPFLCDTCGSRFSSEQPLINHRRVHTGEKPFKCDECGFTCSIQSNLRRHKRAHRGERCYQCVQCGKGFMDPGSLKKHMHHHTGAPPPYKCPHCERCYMNASMRKTHLIKAHGLDPSEIPRLAKDGTPARRYVTEEPRIKPPYTLVTQRVDQTISSDAT